MPEGYEDSHWISYGRVHVNAYAFTGKSPLRESTEYYRIPMEASNSRRAIAQGPRFQWFRIEEELLREWALSRW